MGNNLADSQPPRFSRPIALAASLALLAAVVSGSGCSSRVDTNASSVTANNVRLTPAQRQRIHLYTVDPSRFRRTVEITGVVDFDNDQATSVLAPFSGPVSRLLVSQGDEVDKGTPLASVHSTDFSEAISNYKKALATARTNRRLADLDKDLLQHNGVSQREEAQAETDATNAEADRDAALQALVSLSVPPQTIKAIDEGRSVAPPAGLIRSPVAGTVVERLITPGELLQAGTTACFTVANLSRVWVMAQLFGSDLAAVKVGDPADVATGIDARTFPGKVDKVSALVDPDTRAVAVRVVVDNPARLLRRQMYVRVAIHSSYESSGLLVPVSAVLRDDENLPCVYVAQADGSFARQHVALGYRVGEQYDVREGLRSGAQVVVAGGIFVQFMQSQ